MLVDFCGDDDMAAEFKVKESDVFLRGITHMTRGSHKFIVYVGDKDGRVHINTDFSEREKGVYICCGYYDRILCESRDEYLQMTISDIEGQAYGSFMDGAR